MEPDWSDFRKRLESSKRILISSHVKIDGDGLGSELALLHALRRLGYEATALNPGFPPETFRCLGRDFDEIRVYTDSPSESDVDASRIMSREEALTYDTLIIVDTSARPQLQKVVELTQEPSIQTLIIDHHALSETLTPYNYSDSDAPAAGALVMDLLEFLGTPLDYRESNDVWSIAELLFFAIATDTGWFRFSSTRPKTFLQAARLAQSGASTDLLYSYAYENYSPARIKLLSVVTTNAQLFCEGKAAFSWISNEDFRRFNATYNETTDLVNTMFMTKGVEVALLFSELEGGSVRIGFRSCCDFDVAAIAAAYGGGGHKNAAGATLDIGLKEVMEQVVSRIHKQLKTTI
ncbi:MAG: DHH family phosphoesterase [Planctomycetia bacterium]|nr:DHH family phosphoesterase [Planctomycetia bacterium]